MTQGRPTAYTADLATRICAELSEGRSLREVCKAEDMPAESTVRLWAMENRDGFSAHYATARELGYQSMADDLLDIADDKSGDYTLKDGVTVMDSEAVARARLRVDTRKWMLSKVLPKVYGDRLDLNHSGGVTISVIDNFGHDPE